MAAPAPTQDDALTQLRSFLLTILPAGMEVIAAQVNRVPEPAAADFVLMTPVARMRLSTNLDGYVDTVFTAGIVNATMTVSDLGAGSIKLGRQIFGVGVSQSPPTLVIAQVSGPTGGAGVYTVTNNGQTVASEKMATGDSSFLQAVDFIVQLDVHGPNSAENAQVISTLFRDLYATIWFAANGDGNVTPLYADDPKQIPYIQDQQQFEDRWIVEAHMQVNATILLGQQFADALAVQLISVDANYPT
jgi:hypothetical protein